MDNNRGLEKSLSISNQLEKIFQLEGELLDQIARLGYGESDLFAIRLALDEALINASTHGNREDPELEITIAYQFDETEIKISITDQGEGFDYNSLIDPRLESGLHKIHGRGIFLIHHFMDEVEFNQAGNRISFCYHKRCELQVPRDAFMVHQTDGATVIELTDSLVSSSVELLDQALMGMLKREQTNYLVDLKNLTRVNTAVLNVFMTVLKRINETGGELIFINPSCEVMEAIKLTRLDKILRFEDDIKEALEQMV